MVSSSSVIAEVTRVLETLWNSALELDRIKVFAGVCCVAVTATLLFNSRRKKQAAANKEKKLRMRSTSIGSTSMMVGGLLTAAQAPKYDSIINVLLRFDSLPSLEQVREAFLLHVVPYEHFHSTPYQKDFGPVTWIPQKVDIAKHVIGTRIIVGASGKQQPQARELEQAIRDEAEKHLNTLLSTKETGRPWWEAHHIAVDGSTFGGVLLRVHHAIGDGVSLMEAFAELLTDSSGTPLDLSKAFSPAQRGARRSFNPLKMIYLAFNAVSSFGSVIAATAIGRDSVCAFQDESRLPPVQLNRFSVYFPSHSLSLIKSIKTALDGMGISGLTVNDIEFSLFAGAVARFCKKHGEDPTKLMLRALTAFAVPEKVCQETRYRTLLRNNFTLLFNTLPLSSLNAVDRVKASHKTWDSIKKSTIVPVSFLIHRLNTSLPAAMQQNTFLELFSRHSVVFSNVPGPQEAIFLAGKQVMSAHMLYPNLAQQVGILSLNGTIHMAIVMASKGDKQEIRQQLPQCFLEELQELCTAAGISRVSMLGQIQI